MSVSARLLDTTRPMLRRAALLLLCLVAGSAWAQKPPNITLGEMALLPEYCVDTQGFNYGDRYSNTSPRAAYWVSLMGDDFWDQHHYCWALIKKRRALTPGQSPVLRRGGLQGAMGDLLYLVNKAKPDFVMLPEVYLEMGDIYLLLGDIGAAGDAFAMSRRKKPDYWPACTRWADLLVKLSKQADARAHVLTCLKAAPRQPQLLEAYRRLGGDVEAYLRSLPDGAAAASPAASAASSPG